MCVQKIGHEDPTLANVCETRAGSCRMHAGKRKRVCKSEFYTAYPREHIHVRQLSVMQLTPSVNFVEKVDLTSYR